MCFDHYISDALGGGVELAYAGFTYNTGLSYGATDSRGRYYWEIGGYRYTRGDVAQTGTGWADYKVCLTYAGEMAP